MTKSIIKRAIM